MKHAQPPVSVDQEALDQESDDVGGEDVQRHSLESGNQILVYTGGK
jgi:hypothetical protein